MLENSKLSINSSTSLDFSCNCRTGDDLFALFRYIWRKDVHFFECSIIAVVTGMVLIYLQKYCILSDPLIVLKQNGVCFHGNEFACLTILVFGRFPQSSCKQGMIPNLPRDRLGKNSAHHWHGSLFLLRPLSVS